MEKKESGYCIQLSEAILLFFTISAGAEICAETKKHDSLGTLRGFCFTQEDPIKGYVLNLKEQERTIKYFGPKNEPLSQNDINHLNETIKYGDASLHIYYHHNSKENESRLEIYVNGKVEVGENDNNTPNEYGTRIKRYLGIL